MFLIRTAFWLALLILVLPSNEGDQQRVIGAAESAVKDLRGFCVRNPDVCEKSKSAFSDFGQKAQFGVKMLMDFVKEASSTPTDGETALEPRARPSRLSGKSDGTLTEQDLQPAWSAANRKAGV